MKKATNQQQRKNKVMSIVKQKANQAQDKAKMDKLIDAALERYKQALIKLKDA